MPQRIVQLPKKAEFEIMGCPIIINDHRIMNYCDIFDEVMNIIQHSDYDRHALDQFEKYGVCFKDAIKYYIRELKYDTKSLVYVVFRHYNVHKNTRKQNNDLWDIIRDFSESEAGAMITRRFIDKINNCGNWGELYSEMHNTSRFSLDLKSRIIWELTH